MTFPHPDTGEVRKLFTKREVRTAAFDLDGEELEFYDDLTRYVEDQSMAAAGQALVEAVLSLAEQQPTSPRLLPTQLIRRASSVSAA